jgi:hypothetical protein
MYAENYTKHHTSDTNFDKYTTFYRAERKRKQGRRVEIWRKKVERERKQLGFRY